MSSSRVARSVKLDSGLRIPYVGFSVGRLCETFVAAAADVNKKKDLRLVQRESKA